MQADEAELRIVMTKDGSSTLYAPDFGEHYHSIHGAVQESMHVFMEAGLAALPEGLESVSVFELGFGTGLNALLSLAHRGERSIDYTGLEAYPISPELAAELDFAGAFGSDSQRELFLNMHAAEWGRAVAIAEGFSLTKIEGRWEEWRPEQKYDLIYWDAFAPDAQPELWSAGVMQRCIEMLHPGGIWVSYSARGAVRRALRDAGSVVERLPGPPGKRHMLRATKI